MKLRSLYIASLERNAGTLIASIGLMEILKKSYGKVAFFRPFVLNRESDGDTKFILDYFSLDMKYEDAVGFSAQEVEQILSNRDGESRLVEDILSKYLRLKGSYDFVLISGLCKDYFSSSLDFDINTFIAKNITTPFLPIISGKSRDKKSILESIKIEEEMIAKSGVYHFATFVNRVDETTLLELQKSEISKTPTYIFPEIEELDRPTLNDIKEKLDCELILGDGKSLKRVFTSSKIAAMSSEHFIEHIEDGDLVIVPGDRADILIASFLSLHSRHFPNISGILLSGGFKPNKMILDLLAGFEGVILPILLSADDTWTTALKLQKVEAKILPSSERKISLVLGMFAANLDSSLIVNRLDTDEIKIITPMMFEFNLFERAKKSRKNIVLPESKDERILRATEILLRRDIVDITLLGDREDVLYRASQLGLDIKKANIIDPKNSSLIDDFADEFYKLRSHKGVSLSDAREIVQNDNYFATMMVHKNLASGMVSGSISTTADTIRPALQIIKTQEGISIVSSIFFMCLDTKVLVYGDCAINQNPNAEELAQIAISSAMSAQKFGIEPKIAMLSYSTGDSGSGEDVIKVKEATRIVKERAPYLLVEGPIQYDAAIDKSVARSKLPNSKVAGEANILIFPDLNTGNNTYKAVQRSAKALAIGPVLQGLKKPVNDLSRGCLVLDIVNTVAITAILAQEE